MSNAFDIVAVGNAIVDIMQTAPESFLDDHNIEKGGMTLIDEERALYLTGLFRDAVIAAGGSVANTATGVASLGGTAAFIGVTADDALGANYARAFASVGVADRTKRRKGSPGTGRSIIVITPDGQRSMNTYLGAAASLAPADIDADAIRAAKILFLEGYLFDRDDAKAAFVKAAEIAAAAGRKTAISLSDSFCVDRHRAAFRHLVANHIDILICNEHELTSLYETEDFDAALDQGGIL